MIDPLTVVLDYLATDNSLDSLTNGQIAAKHKFGMDRDRGWSVSAGQGALQVRYVPGAIPELYDEIQAVRLEARCYGITQDEAGAVWRRLVALSRDTHRELVNTTDGAGLLFWLVQDTSPEFSIDPDVSIDMILATFQAEVAEVSLS